MITIINSISLYGVDGFKIEIEVDVQNGIPFFNMVGLPGASIKECKERIPVAIKNSGIDFPLSKIIVNFAPAHLKKEGPHFDFPVAIGILLNIGEIKEFDTKNTAFIGELSLNGDIRFTVGVLPMVLEARKNGIQKIFIPHENIEEVSYVEGIEIYPVHNLREVTKFLNGEITIYPIEAKSSYTYPSKSKVDFSEVKGQFLTKRAVEISASGNHNILLIGPPGGGKTMISKRIPSILPTLKIDDAIETTKIHSISGKFSDKKSFIIESPFRKPHHTSTFVSIIGGGNSPVPGEISLAHNGVLYLDELPEFRRETLEALRQPLEDKSITICRASGNYTFPANFLLISSMNPCKCGYFGYNIKNKECRCNDFEIKRYINKVSGPLMDRIDIHVSVEPVDYKDITSTKVEEDSNSIKKRVIKAREIQENRFKDDTINFNSEMTSSQIKKYCSLSRDSNIFLENVFRNLSLSTRGLNKIIKTSRTIADMEESSSILQHHLAEAVQYRLLDRNII